MAQISVYVEDSMIERIHKAAKAVNCSVSKYVYSAVSDKLTAEETERARKQQLVRDLRGALNDPSFAEPSDISWDTEIPRRYDLI
jgi:hypothetical protein